MSRIEELEKRLAADPNSRIFVQLAEEYRKQGLLDNAIEVCEEGLKKHPQYPSARVALGRALLEAETFDRASEEFEAVLAEVPDNILANKFLGETYHRLGRLEEALQKYRIAQTLAPEDVELEEKMQAVKDEIAGGTPAPQGASPARDEPPASEVPPPSPPPPASSPTRALEPTLHDGAVAAPRAPEPAGPASEAPPPAVPPHSEAVEVSKAASEPSAPLPDDDLQPIPLVDVSEPMVLEGPAYARTSEDLPVDEGIPAEPASLTPPAPAETPSPSEPEIEGEQAFEAPPLELTRGPAAPERGPAPSGSEGPLEIETETMAELYATQGHFERAIAVYRNLLAKSPNEGQYRERIEELQMLAGAAADTGTRRPPILSGTRPDDAQASVEVLERWLEAIRRSRRI